MPDFRFKVGADYSEFLSTSRGVISNLRGELRSLQQQAQVHVREQGNVGGVASELSTFQGRGQAQLDDALRRGVINQTQYNEEVARLRNAVTLARESLTRFARNEGVLDNRTRVSAIDPDKARAAYIAETTKIGGGDRRAAQEVSRQATQEAANTALIAEKSAKLRQSLEGQQAEITAQRENVQLIAQVNNERRRMIGELRREELEQRTAGGSQSGSSVFQRLQAFVANRQTGQDRLPQEFQSFGQFFTSKALTTGGFALSGAVLYGTVQAFRDTIREASSLQRELSIVKAQFDDVGSAADGLGSQPGFKEFASQVVQVSIDTGVAADEVTRVSRQLAGVFKTDSGLPDFNKALDQTHQALKLSQVTGLPYQEITDSLTAITSTFGTSFTTIGDLAVGLEQKFGVLAPEIIKFTADLAPVAKELGFTVEQIAALGAIAQQRSGVSGGALAESFNRALPTIQGNQVGIAEILGQRESTARFVQPVLDALADGKGAQVIAQLTAAYENMTKGQRNALAEMLGGQRNAKAFFAVLQGGKDTIDALNNSNPDQFAGKLDERFKDFQSTVEFAFQRAGRALEEFGLTLFNSGIADGLKLIADNGALVAQFVSQLISLFTSFNDAMGGVPVKLLAIYATLKLISALRSQVNLTGLTGALRGGIAGAAGVVGGGQYGITLPGEEASLLGGGAILSARQGASPVLRRLLGAQRTNLEREIAGQTTTELTATAGTVRTGIAGLLEGLAPIIALTAVTSLVSTIGNINGQVKQAQEDLASKVREELSKGTAPDEIIRRAQSAGGFDNATGSLQRDVELKVLSFGTADTTSPGDKAVDEIQKANAARQIEELTAISKGLTGQEQKRLNALIQLFKNDPAKNSLNDAVARVIDQARTTANPEVRAALESISQQYAAVAQGAQASSAADDFAATVEQVKANYDAGNASLQDLLSAEAHEIDLLRDALEHITDPTAKADAAKKLAAQMKERDQVITAAAQRTADVSIQFSGIRGGNVVDATATARLQQALTTIEQGASPDTQLDATLNALTAQQALLNQAVNAPVFVDGIARAPTTAEKLARLAAGIPIPPALRAAIIKAQLSTATMKSALSAALGNQASFGTDDLINQIAEQIRTLGPQEITVLKTAIDKKITEVENILKSVGVLTNDARAQLEKTLADLHSARAALDNVDPGATVSGDTTDLQNQNAIDQANESKAYQEGLIAQQRALAHGDPVGVARANIRAAQLALRYARASGKPSEVAQAQAQLIEAQNELSDANANIIQARYAVAIASAAGNPVEQARLQLAQLQEAARTVHGEAERLQNEAQQIAANRSLHDAMEAVFLAQLSLAEAVATAAGDSVKAAKIGAQQAQEKLNDLLTQGADPNGAAVLAAKQSVVEANSRVRDAQLATQERDIDFALQMEQITTQQAIAQLQALLQIPNLTAEQTQQILLKIKQLQNDLSRDLQFDIPNDIKLPTLYEVRRLQQVGTPSGPQTYQDQRSYEINLNASSQVDLQPAIDAIVGVMTAPPRNGSEPGVYSN